MLYIFVLARSNKSVFCNRDMCTLFQHRAKAMKDFVSCLSLPEIGLWTMFKYIHCDIMGVSR